MRVLFAVNPVPTIFMYLVPLAWALRTAGHEVVVASQPSLTDEITATGLTAVAVGRNGFDAAARRRFEESATGSARAGADRNAAEHPVEDPLEADRAGVPEPYDAFDDPAKQTWDYLAPRLTGAVRGWHWMECAPMVAGLVRFARRWRPDLVIWDPLTFGAPVAAKACGAAHARVLFGADVVGATRRHFLDRLAEQPHGSRVDPFAEWFAAYGTKYGFDFSEDMVTGQFTVDQFPDSLRTPTPGLRHLRMRHVPHSRAASIPRWVYGPRERPRVALTLGLSATEHFNGYTVPVGDIVRGIASLGVEVVATVAEEHREALGALPASARVVPFVPWQSLVPTCAVVVHHAGAATLATTSGVPVPQLAIPYHFDQPFLADKLRAHGAGLAVPSDQATGDSIRDAVRRLLDEPSFAVRAQALAAETDALPSPNSLVPDLVALTAECRARGDVA